MLRRVGGRASAVLLVVLAAAIGVVGCGGGDDDAAHDRPAGAGQRAASAATAFDVSFVPGTATQLVVIRTGAPLRRARQVASRAAAWPILEAYLPTRAGALDAALGQVGLDWPATRETSWMGDEVGAARLQGSGWITWASVRPGRDAAARSAGRDLLRSAPEGSQVALALTGGRMFVASSDAVLAASRRVARSSSIDRAAAWVALRPDRARRASMAAVLERGRAAVVGVDDRGFWVAGSAPRASCASSGVDDAVARLGRRPAGAGVVLASGTDAAVDHLQLLQELGLVERGVRGVARDGGGSNGGSATSGVARQAASVADLIGFLRTLPAATGRAVGGAEPLDQDPRFEAARAAAHAPSSATSAYWIDTALVDRLVVDELLRRGRIGKTTAAVAGSATQGIDGALLWTEPVQADGRCATRIGGRLAVPPAS